jgi:putative flippase GtrA
MRSEARMSIRKLKSRFMGNKGLILNNRFVQFIVYILVGGITTVFTVALLYLFTDLFHIWYLISAAIAYLLGWGVHYTLNRTITFQNKSRLVAKQFLVFLTIALAAMALNLLLLSVFVELFKVWYVLAQMIVTLIMFFLNYLANRYITFRIFK